MPTTLKSLKIDFRASSDFLATFSQRLSDGGEDSETLRLSSDFYDFLLRLLRLWLRKYLSDAPYRPLERLLSVGSTNYHPRIKIAHRAF